MMRASIERELQRWYDNLETQGEPAICFKGVDFGKQVLLLHARYRDEFFLPGASKLRSMPGSGSTNPCPSTQAYFAMSHPHYLSADSTPITREDLAQGKRAPDISEMASGPDEASFIHYDAQSETPLIQMIVSKDRIHFLRGFERAGTVSRYSVHSIVNRSSDGALAVTPGVLSLTDMDRSRNALLAAGKARDMRQQSLVFQLYVDHETRVAPIEESMWQYFRRGAQTGSYGNRTMTLVRKEE